MKMTDCSQNCGGHYSYGLAATLSIISGKWKPLILYFLLDGPKRYGELKRNVHGVSAKVLIQQLKELEADHVLARTADKIVPLCAWGTENMAEMVSILAKRDTLP